MCVSVCEFEREREKRECICVCVFDREREKSVSLGFVDEMRHIALQSAAARARVKLQDDIEGRFKRGRREGRT